MTYSGPDMLALAEAGDPVALARTLVSTPSVNPSLTTGGAGEGEVARLCATWLERWGFDVDVVEVAPLRWNVIAQLDGAGPTLLLNGHIDTVGVAGMTIPPFSGRVEDGRILGRGACDMKGGIASLLAAAYRLSRSGPRPGLVVALTADEEHASLGMARLMESGVRADMAVVCEPTSLAVMPAHKGFVWVKATFRGRAAHGSRPDIGVDAIQHAGRYLALLDGYSRDLAGKEPHPLLGYGSVHAGLIEGGSAESVYPDWCEVVLERRTLPGETESGVESEFRALLDRLAGQVPDLKAELEVTLARPGTEVGTDSPLVQGLLDASGRHDVVRPIEGMTAWVDAAYLNEAGIPAVCFGPGSIAQAHAAEEWVDVREVEVCADILESFARDLSTAG
ncbi:MAG: M20/M25/M40 family metallo-hydrolase [Gemmatimonadota bacterium]|nr:M20/M25/M40 family metallo-hydrolase [Gemmatimonadota bacterium]